MWCKERNNWLSAAHLPGSMNVDADTQSRVHHDNMEWRLDKHVFADIARLFRMPSVNLFASRLNNQVDNYISWKPDPAAMAVDAFTTSWSEDWFYAFPLPSVCSLPLCRQCVRNKWKELLSRQCGQHSRGFQGFCVCSLTAHFFFPGSAAC